PTGKLQLFLADWDAKAAPAALKTSPERGAGAGVLPALRPRERPGVEAHKAVPPPHVGGYASEIRVADLRSEVDYLASDALEGRLPGAKGARLPAELIGHQCVRDG